MPRDIQWDTWFTSERVRIARFAALLLIAEVATAIQPWPGALLHVALLIWLAARAATAVSQAEGRLLAALMILPLLRLVTLTLPAERIAEPLWPGLAAIITASAIAVAVRRLGIAPSEIGLTSRGFWLQLPLSGIGLGLGAISFLLIPETATTAASEPGPLITATGVAAIAALTESILLRGLVLMLALPILGAFPSLLLSAAVATSLQLGYGSVTNLALTSLTSVLYGYLAVRGGSIVGVSLAHVLASVSFFVLLPHFELTSLVAVITAVGLVAAASLHFIGRPPSGSVMPATRIRRTSR